jgi:polysaccharide biosynthesis transport protein
MEPRPANAPLGERRSLMDVWRVLTKQRVTIITATILFLACAVWYAFRTPPVYESVSRIEIKPNEFGNGDLLGLFEAEDEAAEGLQTEVRILQSDSVLFQTAQALNLLPVIRGENKTSGQGPQAPPTPQERRALIGIVRGGLSVSIIPNTRLVEIHYRNNDPKLATNIVNQLVETYADQELQTKFERTQHVSTWLQNRMDDLRQEASDTQRRLADYQRQHNIVGTDENSNLTTQTLEDISSELDSAEADRITKEARMREFDALNPDMIALEGDNAALSNLRAQLTDLQTQRAQLASKYGPKHPAMQQLDQEISKVQTQVDNEVELARHQVTDEYQGAVGLEGDLRKRLGEQEDATYRLNEDVAQYDILRHQAELTRDLYDSLQMRLKAASISAGMSAANITVVDQATIPFIPVEPQKRKSLMYGLFGGLFVGCVLAFVIESIDDRLRTSEEVEAASMLPSLAAIPNMTYTGTKHKGDPREKAPPGTFQTPHQLITLWDPKSHGAESYRGMRSSLLLSSIDNPPRVIVITSAFPAEGKTTTAINFAIVLAQRGEQVLLVDADLRRGSLRRVFGITDENYGLSTALSQQTPDKELPVPFPELPTLHVLPTGPLPPNPAEMLSSNRMEEQMRQWVKKFDRIVMDSAPLLAVSDSQALAVRSDAVVLVARAGVTRKRALIRARDLLWRVNAPVAGVVVNDVDLRLENFYTYRYGAYARNYWYGYKQAPSFSDRAYGYEDDQELKGE